MNTNFDVIVIGAGQAGLAAGYFLDRAGVRFTMLDASAGIGDSWRNRWDSLRLFTPARYNGLPGMPFPGKRYALPNKDDVASYLTEYARTFRLPIELGTTVSSLRHENDRFVVEASNRVLRSSSVIVATGANQRPYVPQFASQLSPSIAQLHSSEYRRPEQLPLGKVLVVGAGNSGAQIALELAASGRRVILAGRPTGALPRRFLGRDIYDWLWPTIMRPSIESRVGRRLMQSRLYSGDPLIGMDARSLERPGLVRAGRVTGVSGGKPILEGAEPCEIDAVVWCTGFRPDYTWIELPVFGLDGYPRHRRGLSIDMPGLGFLGMRFQYRMGSALLGGVGEDARWLVQALVTRRNSDCAKRVAYETVARSIKRAIFRAP